MRQPLLKSCVSLAVLGIAGMSAPACAGAAAVSQAVPAPQVADAGKAADTLGEIVVTASGRDKTKLKSSITVTSATAEQITNFTPRNEAEVLRTIAGLNLQDAAGSGGNANIGVRGIPVSTGGSEYVALQEDGLPIVLFGDINFGNNDYWIRFDNNVARVEAVVGGSASTFASQAPGAVINYISKTGEKQGGEVALSEGLDFRETRVDFDYGGPITDSLRFHIGGFYKDGDGADHIGFTAEKGYQIKGNITKDFADGKGYFRLNFKRLDDQEPVEPSVPIGITESGTAITGFSGLPGISPQKWSGVGIYNENFQILNAQGNLQNVQNQGIHPKVTSFGGELHYEVGSSLTVNDNFRWSDASGTFDGRWVGPGLTSQLGTAAAAAPGQSLVYAAGPAQGQVYTGAYYNDNALAHVTMNDMGNMVNDLTLSGKFDAGAGAHVSAKAGWFHMRQNIATDWRINNYIDTLDSNRNPVPLDAFAGPNGTGAQLTADGLTGFNNQWGGCCGGRSYNLSYTDDAPYLDLDGKIAGLDLDASLRWDSVSGSGVSYSGVAGAPISVTDALGTAALPTYNTNFAKPVDTVNYRKSYVSWSLGALYEVNNDTSIFARVSRGGRFNADRLLYAGNFNADGSLDANGQHDVVNFVSQQELGLKHRGQVAAGGYNVEATFFRTELDEHNYDFTQAIPVLDAEYHSYGIELKGALHAGHFSLDGAAVWTHARTVADPAAPLDVGQTPAAVPSLTYRLSPSYDMGVAAFGFSLHGQNAVYANADGTLKEPGAALVSAFVKLRPYQGLELGLNASNLFNTLAYLSRSNGTTPISGNSYILAGQQGAVEGRTVTASLHYHF